ncbi:MAG: dienelactone hydrolase family protein [Armatimonadetes bacterium]|nr:dienelactone hydrolase family protein [Armatimonadota bacterium]
MASPGGQEAKSFKRSVRIEQTGNYLLYLPKDYGKTDKHFPLLIFLHGAGERGDDLDKVKVHGPPRYVNEGQEFPFIIVSPQCPENRWWDPLNVLTLLTEIEMNYRVDVDRVYLTGLSMGGFGTWALGAMYPDKFAALAPICGGGEPRMTMTLGGMPIWAVHGRQDGAVAFVEGESMVNAAAKNGANVKFTIYTDGGHDVWTTTYSNPKFYEWLLSHRRSDRKGGPTPATQVDVEEMNLPKS